MTPKGRKPRVAFFDFACCEGCQLTVLELDERLLDLLGHVDVVEWREASSASSDDYDIAFCEGSITRSRDIVRIRHIRARVDTLVTLGTCASIACHNALKNSWHMGDAVAMVYGRERSAEIDTIAARPVSAVVPVDYKILGCPVSLPELETVFKLMMTGQEHQPPNQPVCVECKRNDTLCVYEKGMVCLGPVTRCGCEAICTRYGDPCQGCRGLLDMDHLEAAVLSLTDEHRHAIMAAVVKKHRLTEDDVRRKFSVYNQWPGTEKRGYGHGRT